MINLLLVIVKKINMTILAIQNLYMKKIFVYTKNTVSTFLLFPNENEEKNIIEIVIPKNEIFENFGKDKNYHEIKKYIYADLDDYVINLIENYFPLYKILFMTLYIYPLKI